MPDDVRARLEAAIDDDPDHPASYLVLADWLQEQGDPHGELIVRWRDAKASQVAKLGTLAERQLGVSVPQHGNLTWFYGFVRGIRAIVDEDDAAKLADVFAHRAARHLSRIHLDVAGGRYDDELQWLVDLLAKFARPSWRSISLNCYVRGGNEPPRGTIELGELWPKIPRVRELRVTARYIDPTTLASPNLEILELDGEVADPVLAPLFDHSLPALRELHLHDISDRIARELEAALGAQLVKGTFTTAGPDRYEQTGE